MSQPVTVHADQIDALGDKFIALQQDLDPATNALGSVSVVPGAFVDADALKTTVDSRRTETQTLMANIKGALAGIGGDLKALAMRYQSTENGNATNVSDLDTVVNDAEKKLPGILRNHAS